jgi:protein transport protein SEC61 subunit alpha
VNINVQNKRIRGQQPPGYQVKLFYTSNIPIILQSALISNLFFMSQMLSKKFRGNFFINLLGNWQELESGGQSVPIGGLAYYISPPRQFSDTFRDPFHTMFYIGFVLITCALFSKTWIEVSGSSPKDVCE